jgi:hypothetical protein
MRLTTDQTGTGTTREGAHHLVAHHAADSTRESRACIRCGTTHDARRAATPVWTPGNRGDAGALASHATLCGACRMASAGTRGGQVMLDGAFVTDHQAEIERVIRGEAARAAGDDTPGRILCLGRPKRGRLTVTTSTDLLARRVGQALRAAFGGTIHCDVPHEQPFARVTWIRDE